MFSISYLVGANSQAHVIPDNRELYVFEEPMKRFIYYSVAGVAGVFPQALDAHLLEFVL